MATSSMLDRRVAVAVSIALLVGIGLTRMHSYLLFHGTAEALSIAIAVGTFIIAWHSRDLAGNPYFLFLGIGGACAAGIDIVHTLAFKGMGVFPGSGSNLPTQLWVAARYVESLVFLTAPLFIGRKPRPAYLLLGSVAAFGLLVSLISWGVFPACYVEGVGLTPFKKVSEYVISAFFAAAGAFLVLRRDRFDPKVLALLVTALAVKVVSEITFTLYVEVDDTSNLLGHLLRIVAAALIYWGIVMTGFEMPYRLLFRQMKQREEELSSALSEVRTLSGMLPICMNCKKIRNDTGYWQQIESYISAHSGARFTHGLCPECARLLYPDFTGPVERGPGGKPGE